MKISIITVVKNDYRNISKTINSVINQTYKNIEYIIIDGKSNDGTYEKIKKELKKVSKINIKLVQKIDKNMYDAINNGIKISNGDIIGLIHSGDEYFNNKTIKEIVDNFKDGTNILSGKIIFYKRKKITRLWDYKISKLNKYSCFKIAHTSLFLKRNLIKKTGLYSLKYSICSDTDFLFRLSKVKNTKFKFLNKFLIKMPVGGLSTSNSFILRKIIEDFKIYYKNFNLLFIFFYLNKIIYKLIKLIVWKFKVNY